MKVKQKAQHIVLKLKVNTRTVINLLTCVGVKTKDNSKPFRRINTIARKKNETFSKETIKREELFHKSDICENITKQCESERQQSKRSIATIKNENLLSNHQAIVSNVLSTDKQTTFYTGLKTKKLSSAYNNLLNPSVNK